MWRRSEPPEVAALNARWCRWVDRPWLAPGVLARSDRDILLDLLARCRKAERQLSARSWTRVVPDWAPRAIMLSLLAAAGITLFVAGAGGWLSALGRLRGWSDDFWFAVKYSSDVERPCFVGIVLIVVSMFTVSRTPRS
jgi:hypothetical protein